MSRLRPKYTAGMNDIRQLLDKIGMSDMRPDQKDWALWTLLGALRGPDSDDAILKNQTTARLRAKICPDLAWSAHAYRSPGKLHQMNVYGCNPKHQHHFLEHYNQAIKTLVNLKMLVVGQEEEE